jgi:23S rRNA pseudouridine2605 synthase
LFGTDPHMTTKPPIHATKPPRHGVARVVSKLGMASRTQAAQWVREGRVRVNGHLVHDAEFPVRQGVDRIDIDGQVTTSTARLALMLNKPRGLVTTASDEQGRDTVYSCFAAAGLPWIAPVGRLDKASEGLLLFSNDPAWAAQITDPLGGQSKTYHVQIDRLPDAALLAALAPGVTSVRCLRSGGKNAWLEIILDEGRNRQIRRLLSALDVAVLRLVRVAVGPLQLGELPKGQWRLLTAQEVASLTSTG